MTGRGKGGKGLGKGGAKRHRKVLRDNIQVNSLIRTCVCSTCQLILNYAGHHQAGHPKAGQKRRSQEDQWSDLWRDQRCLEGDFPFSVLSCMCCAYRCSWRMSSATLSPTLSMPRGRPSPPWMLSMLSRDRVALCMDLEAKLAYIKTKLPTSSF